MKRLVSVIILLFLSVVVVADDGIIEVRIVTPGGGGVNSVTDATQIDPSQSQYQENVDVTSRLGTLRKRTRIVSWGTDTTRIDGAMQYWNRGLGHLGLLSLDYSDRSYIYTDNDPDDIDEVTVTSALSPYIGQPHEFSIGNGFLLHCDGKNLPRLFTTGRLFSRYLGADTLSDTTQRGPRIYQLGLEPPGAPILSVDTCSGDSCLTGDYQYSFSFYQCQRDNDTWWSVGGNPLGPPSRVISPDGERVRVTGFPFMPQTECTTTTVKVWRREVRTRGVTNWELRGTASLRRDSLMQNNNDNFHASVVFWDNDSASATTITYDPVEDGYFTQQPVPGMLYASTNGGGDDLVYYRVSYYDPYLDIESPLGPPLKISLDSNRTFMFPAPDTALRPLYMRVYRAVADTNIIGGGDSTLWYGIAEFPASSYQIWNGYGFNGLTDTFVVSSDSTRLGNRFWTAAGDVVSRPPYEYANEITFSDMAFVDDRYWGVGGLYRNRLYYSTNYDVGRWNPDSSVIALDEEVNDEIVAIEPAYGLFKDHLYAIKRNSVYMVVGAIADYGFDVSGDTPYPFRKIANSVGAVGRKAVHEHRGGIYFLSPSIRAYRITGQTVEEIGGLVKDRLDSLFTSYADAVSHARVMSAQDEVMFINDNTGKIMAFNTLSGTWGAQRYWIDSVTSLVPTGVVRYDTSSLSPGFDYYSDLMFFNTTIGLYERDRNERADAYVGIDYITPLFGDGTRNWSMIEVQLDAHVRSWTQLNYEVLNQDGRILLSDSLLIDTLSGGDVRFHPGAPHFGKHLALRLYTRPGVIRQSYLCTNDIEISSIMCKLRTAGKTTITRGATRVVPPVDGDTSSHAPGS